MTLPLVPLGWHELIGASSGGWIAAIYLGLLPSAVGFVLSGCAVGRLPVAACTSLLYLVPPVAVLIAWLWLGELPLVIELLGRLVVIVGVVVISQGGRILARIRPQTQRRSKPKPGDQHTDASRV